MVGKPVVGRLASRRLARSPMTSKEGYRRCRPSLQHANMPALVWLLLDNPSHHLLLTKVNAGPNYVSTQPTFLLNRYSKPQLSSARPSLARDEKKIGSGSYFSFLPVLIKQVPRIFHISGEGGTVPC